MCASLEFPAMAPFSLSLSWMPPSSPALPADRKTLLFYSLVISLGLTGLSAVAVYAGVMGRSRKKDGLMGGETDATSEISVFKCQNGFKRVLIDNSDAPFVHLKRKNQDPSDPHPFGKEIRGLIEKPYKIEKFLYPQTFANISYLAPLPPLPAPPLKPECIWISNLKDLRSLITILSKEREIGVDTEQHQRHSYFGFTALLQISTWNDDYIIDTIALHDHIHLLSPIFSDPSILKVFHGADSDVLWLQRDFHIYVVNLFDTFKACSVLEKPKKSLSFLLETYCNIITNKEFQKADWRIRPLSKQMLNYARIDAHYLLYLATVLKFEIISKDLENNFPLHTSVGIRSKSYSGHESYFLPKSFFARKPLFPTIFGTEQSRDSSEQIDKLLVETDFGEEKKLDNINKESSLTKGNEPEEPFEVNKSKAKSKSKRSEKKSFFNQSKISLYFQVIRHSNAICLQLFGKENIHNSNISSIISRYYNSNFARSLKINKLVFHELVSKLCTWRDKIARAEDESIRFVLSDNAVIELASTLPTTSEDVLLRVKCADSAEFLYSEPVEPFELSNSQQDSTSTKDFFPIEFASDSTSYSDIKMFPCSEGEKLEAKDLNLVFPPLSPPSYVVLQHVGDIIRIITECIQIHNVDPSILSSVESKLNVKTTQLDLNEKFEVRGKSGSKYTSSEIPLDQRGVPKRWMKVDPVLAREKFIKKFSCRGPVYENCRIYSNDGRLLCFCDKKKIEWYVGRGLAEYIEEGAPAVKLLFEPKGRPDDADNEFYIQSKSNACVSCGESSHYLRYRLVPSCYRQHFPEHLKSHRSHDIVLLCVDCHEVAHKAAEKHKRKIATAMNIPLIVKGKAITLPGQKGKDWEGENMQGNAFKDGREEQSIERNEAEGLETTIKGEENAFVNLSVLRNSVIALVRHGSTMPQKRIDELLDTISSFYGRRVDMEEILSSINSNLNSNSERKGRRGKLNRAINLFLSSFLSGEDNVWKGKTVQEQEIERGENFVVRNKTEMMEQGNKNPREQEGDGRLIKDEDLGEGMNSESNNKKEWNESEMEKVAEDEGNVKNGENKNNEIEVECTESVSEDESGSEERGGESNESTTNNDIAESIKNEQIKRNGREEDEPIISSERKLSRRQVQRMTIFGHAIHGKKVVDLILQNDGEGLRNFIQQWREVFVDSLNPRYLPSAWDVHHSGKREFGDYSIYKPKP